MSMNLLLKATMTRTRLIIYLLGFIAGWFAIDFKTPNLKVLKESYPVKDGEQLEFYISSANIHHKEPLYFTIKLFGLEYRILLDGIPLGIADSRGEEFRCIVWSAIGEQELNRRQRFFYHYYLRYKMSGEGDGSD